MGLLTDSSQPEKVTKFLRKYQFYISLISFVAGIIWFAALAYDANNGATYFSENALLPGLVEGKFNLGSDVHRYLENLQEEMDRYQDTMPTAWFQSQFRQLGLEVYLHNFTLHYPLGSKSVYTGYNMYAIMRAPRTASTEALVLATPYRSLKSVHPATYPGIAFMLALAKFFRQHSYWSKDIIFLISEHEQLGAKAWLEAYHGVGSFDGILDAGVLASRSGVIQAAINLELHSATLSSIDVKIEGLTGQLPNLDLFNLIVRLCGRDGVPVTFKNRAEHPRPQTFDGWLHHFGTLMAMIRSQAVGVPNGNHGLFLRYNIEALTLEGHSGRMKHRVTALQVGRVLEGIFRSLNNLLESLHQSFFFYLLPATDRYISIGLYMPPFGLMLLAIVFSALKLRIDTQNICSESGSIENDPSFGIVSALPYVMTSHLIGVAVFLTTVLFDAVGHKFEITSEDAIFYGIFAMVVAILLFPRFLNKWQQICNWKVLKYVTILEMTLLLATVALVNFSLALLVTTISVPVILSATPTTSRIGQLLKSLILIMISPLSLAFLATLYDTYAIQPDIRIDSLLARTWVALKRAILYSVADHYIYTNWMFCVACVFHLPVWIQLWCTLYSPSIYLPWQKKSKTD